MQAKNLLRLLVVLAAVGWVTDHITGPHLYANYEGPAWAFSAALVAIHVLLTLLLLSALADEPTATLTANVEAE